MKTHAIAALAATLLLAPACTSPERTATFNELNAAYSAAVADGVVTDAEASEVNAKLKAFNDAPSGGQDWATILATAVGTLTAGFFGIRYAPNSILIGKQEALALDQVAKKTT